MKNETVERIGKSTYLLDGKSNGYHTYLIRAAFKNVLIDSGLDEILLSRQEIRSLPAVFSLTLPNPEVWETTSIRSCVSMQRRYRGLTPVMGKSRKPWEESISDHHQCREVGGP
jgi:hypothetical protein